MREKYPTVDWTLGDWIAAVGSPRNADMCRVAGLTSRRIFGFDQQLPEGTLRDWIKKGLPDRDNSIWIMAVLRHFALRGGIEVFSNRTILWHSRIFLNSRACKMRFADLDPDELQAVTQQSIDVGPDARALADLQSLVRPQPPLRLLGRDTDLATIIAKMAENSILVIESGPGSGKTALGWFAARQAIHLGLCSSFDWTTDKRLFISPYGELVDMGDVPPLSFEAILLSMVRRFEWIDLFGATGHYLENGCADLLRKGRYLVVVDNIETAPDGKAIVDNLSRLFAPVGSLRKMFPQSVIHSRALITSRVKIRHEQCIPHSIAGIDVSGWIQLVRNTETVVATSKHRLTDEQCHQLGKVYRGNPLMMQIAVSQYHMLPEAQTFDEVLHSIQGNLPMEEVFKQLFLPQLQQLSDDELWIARFIAQRGATTFGDIEENWHIQLEQVGAEIDSRRIQRYIFKVLEQLSRLYIVDRTDDGTYAMHPQIRRVLLQS